MFENLFRRHSLDPFLQKQAQRGEIGVRQGDREFCIWVKTCLPQPFHNLIHVLMVCRVNLANQAMASTLSAENNLQSAMRLPMAGQHLRSEEHTSELQSHSDLVCRLLLEKKKKRKKKIKNDNNK